MPRIKIRRSENTNVSVANASLLDGELFWDKSAQQLYIGEESDNSVTPRKIQKQITVSNAPPTSLTEGMIGDIYIWYQN